MSEATEVTEIVERVREHLAAAVGIGHPDEEGYIDFLTEILAALTAATQRAEAAEAERDDIIAICRGTQLDDAAIHSMRGYVTEKLRIEAECNALRKDAALLREFVSSDEIAMTYQTMKQYRAALLKFHTAALAVQPTTGDGA